jgi:drug/metabolite transporter (DMT)-like permease
MKPSQWRADLALAFLAFIWGSTFVLVKNALADISTVFFLALRFGAAALLLLAIYGLRGRSWRLGGWRWGIALGSIVYLGFLLQTIGLRYTTPAKSGFITGLYIVFVPVLSAAVYRKTPKISEWAGVLLALAGLALLTLDLSALSMGYGDTLTVACALAFAVHIVLLGHYSKLVDSDWLALLQVGVAALLAAITLPAFETPYIRSTPVLAIAIAVTAVLATALAFWIQTWAQKHTTATRAALLFSLEPVFAWLTSFLIEDERLTSRALTGAACIFAGILLVELKPSRQRIHQ